MPLPLIEEAAKLGAYIEFVSAFATAKNAEDEIKKHVDVIRRVGANRVILSSDRGQANGPTHPDALVTAARALMSHGITEAEVSQMMKDNPARLLGLAP
jgi:predicted metal-dependent TIM-barrel fold hydrolase